MLCPNTPAFLESVFGIGAAGAVNVGEYSPLKLRKLLAKIPERGADTG